MFTETELRDALAHSAARADDLVPDGDRLQSHAPAGGWRRFAMPLLTAAMVAGTVVGVVVATSGNSDRGSVPAARSATPTATPTSPSGVRVRVVDVRDEGKHIVIRWTGPATHEYAVVVAPQGGSVLVVPTNHKRRTTLTVTPGKRYCIVVQSTDGKRVVETTPRGLRGATCSN